MSSGRRSGAGRVLCWVAVGCGLAGAACGGQPSPSRQEAVAPERGEVLSYAWGTTDGGVVSSDALRGRATVLLFVTTFDLASQAQAKHLEDVYRTHKPRINAVAVVMEPPKYAPLASSFAEVLGLSYPVALADDATRTGQGPFGAIQSVPSWVVLDRDSRLAFAHAGVVSVEQLVQRVRGAQR